MSPRKSSPPKPRGCATAKQAAREAAATAARAFAGSAAEGLPTFMLKPAKPVLIIDVAIALGMASSKSEARRLIDQGGVRLNDQPVTAATASVTDADLGTAAVPRGSASAKSVTL